MTEYKIVPLSTIKSSNEDVTFTACLSSGYEFQAMYKSPEGNVGRITVNILGKLKPEWEMLVNNSIEKEITIPLVIAGTTVYVDKSIME